MVIVEIESILYCIMQVQQGMQVRKLDFPPHAWQNGYFKKKTPFLNGWCCRNRIFNRALGENRRHHYEEWHKIRIILDIPLKEAQLYKTGDVPSNNFLPQKYFG
jgi:hypothetical protein